LTSETTSAEPSVVASKPPSTSTNVTMREHENVSAAAHSKIARALPISGSHRPRAGQVVSSAAAPEAEDGTARTAAVEGSAEGSGSAASRAEVDAPGGQELDRQPARADRRRLGHRRAGSYAPDRLGGAPFEGDKGGPDLGDDPPARPRIA